MLRVLRFLFALLICSIALVLPYRARLIWFNWIAALIHLPFRVFGRLARFILNRTETDNPFGD